MRALSEAKRRLLSCSAILRAAIVVPDNVVRRTGLERKLAQGDPARRGEIRRAFVLHRPTALLKQRVDFFPGEFFWGRHGCKEYGVAFLLRVNFFGFYAI